MSNHPTNEEIKLFAKSTLVRRVNNLYMALAYVKAQIFKNKVRSMDDIMTIMRKSEGYEINGMPPKAEQMRERRK